MDQSRGHVARQQKVVRRLVVARADVPVGVDPDVVTVIVALCPAVMDCAR